MKIQGLRNTKRFSMKVKNRQEELTSCQTFLQMVRDVGGDDTEELAG